MLPLLSYKIYKDKQKALAAKSEIESVAKPNLKPQCKCGKNRRIKKVNYLEITFLLFGMLGIPITYIIYWNVCRMYQRSDSDKNNELTKIQIEKPNITEEMSDFLKSIIAERLKNKDKYNFEYSWTKIDRRSGLSMEEFHDMYSGKWPVIITNCGNKWPAFKKWTKKYFVENYGKELVTVKTSANGVQETFLMPLDLFLSHLYEGYPNQWTYLTDEMFIPSRTQLEQDIGTCNELEEDFFKLFPIETRPWWSLLLWGTVYSRSDLHIDPFNWTGTNMVFSGLKRWKLFPPGQDHLLHIIPDQQYKFPINFFKYNSYADCFNNDHLKQFPSIGKAKVIEFYQYPGELLIIPTGWFHQAINEEVTLAVSGQIMNRDNYKIILEELYKGGEFLREETLYDYIKMSPLEHVKNVLSKISKETLRRGKEITLSIYNQAKQFAESSGLPKPPLIFDKFYKN